MINKKIIGILTGILIVFIILFGNVSAFAVSSAYTEENPVKILPGETKDISFTLQNMAGSEDITAKASILQGSEILELIGPRDIYSVPVGSKTGVNARVNIPSDAKIGEVYNVEVGFTTITESDAGAFSLGGSVGRRFKVIAATPAIAELPEEKPKIRTSIIILVAVMIIVIITILILMGKKVKNKGN